MSHISIFRQFIVWYLLCGLGSCIDPGEAPQPENGTEVVPLLVFPLKDSECNEGTVLTDSTVAITFVWRGIEGGRGYRLQLVNLLTDETQTATATIDSVSVTLQRVVPYAWQVTATNANGDERPSKTWRFYVAGEGISAYAPFPAEAVYPRVASVVTAPAGTVNLQWQGSDADGDITAYNVYFGESSPPPLLAEALADTLLNDVPVTPGRVYYWQVTTTDAAGNSSFSQVFQFGVE